MLQCDMSSMNNERLIMDFNSNSHMRLSFTAPFLGSIPKLLAKSTMLRALKKS